MKEHGVTLGEDVLHNVSKTVATKSDSVLAHHKLFHKVFLGDGLINSDSGVKSDSDFVAFVAPHAHVEVLVLSFVGNGVSSVQLDASGLNLKSGPVLSVDGSSDRVVLGVHDLVEERMELIDIVMVLEINQIATLVTVGVGCVVERFVVQRLVHVTHVVDEQAESVGLGDIFVTGVQTVLNVVVDVALQVVIAIVGG